VNKWQKKSLVLALTSGMLVTSLGAALAAENQEDTPGFELDQVVVTATKTQKKIKDVPVVVQVITREEMDKKHVQNVDDALKGVSGIMIKRNNGLTSSEPTVIMRGFKQRGILVLVDGQSQNDGYNGQITWSQVPIENIERIEIVKGPGSALYGSNAQGGVINIITKSKPANETVLKLGIGSHGEDNKAFSHSGSTGKIDYFVDYAKIKSNGFISAYLSDKDNYRGHQTGDQEHASGKVTYHFDENSRLSISSNEGNSAYDYELGTDQGNKKSRGLTIDYQSKVNDKLNYQITWGEKKTDNWYYSGYSSTKTKQSLTHQSNKFETNDGDTHFNWQIDDKNLLTIGYAFRKEDGRAYDERGLTKFYPEYTWGFLKSEDQIDRKAGGKTKSDSFYFQDEHKLDEKLTSFIGGRYTKWETSGGWNSYRATTSSDPISTQYNDREATNFSGKMGMVYKADGKTTWKFNVGQGFRTPTFYELFRSSQDSTTGTITTSNPDLKPEKSTSYDLNWDYQVDSKTMLSASCFYTQLKDAITTMEYSVIDGYVPNIGTLPGVTKEKRQSNADRAVMKGFELGLNKQLSKTWSSFINYTYTDAQITESENPAAIVGKQMTDIPKHMFNFGFDYNNKKWKGNITGRKISDTKDDGAQSGKYGSYDPVFLVDMKVSYLVDKNSTISLSVDNLFDREYWSYYLAPTRSVYLEYSYKF